MAVDSIKIISGGNKVLNSKIKNFIQEVLMNLDNARQFLR